jgi:crotonobetainyl-CoA:carnitine CoA-transferase CaiB-like acyl-CoA transferase
VVLDFTSMIAGPYAGRLMADAGATVIKIEPPEGDDMRQRAPIRDGHGTYFGQLNTGKQSVVLDLKRDDARALCLRLIARADVVLENFRPGVMRRLGLDFDSLKVEHPRLIYCAISGYGQSGPLADQPAYAPIVHAASGIDRAMMRYAGQERPMRGAVFFADIMGGTYAYAGILTALAQRDKSGQGQLVDVSLMDSMLNLLTYEIQAAQFPVPAHRPLYGPIRAADGDLLVAPITQRNFLALVQAIGRPELKDDARFAKVPARSLHWLDLMAEIETWSCTRALDECIATLSAGGVPCSRYADPADALANPHLAQRGTFAPVQDGAGSFVGVNPPYQLSGGGTHLRSPVPARGADTEAVLRTLAGLDDTALASARAAGAFGA